MLEELVGFQLAALDLSFAFSGTRSELVAPGGLKEVIDLDYWFLVAI